ncbi:AAA domain-containing protein [Dactylosporangium cerinum]|uniref:AAA domain-containing protein n=1 Tax=Dactylosporangium cerinum TaxID=1434730 RepID=A0ABV9VT46_9ACTN
MSTETAGRLVGHFLCGETAEFGPFSALDEDEPVELEELLAGRLYRARMLDRNEQSVDVELFLGIEEMGGLLWEQDVRALLRMSASPHPALPEVLDGGYLTHEQTMAANVPGGMAFVASRGGLRCAGPKDVDYFRAHPADAVRQFRSLAEGLAELHFLGITHRGLSPESIAVFDGPRMRLARFELSSLIADLFRTALDGAADPDELRRMFGRQLLYAPVERVAYLYGGDSNLMESEKSDVYSLAAIAYEWFVGPLPADRLSVPPPGTAAASAAEVRAGYTAFAQHLRDTADGCTDTPAELAAILARMLHPDGDVRPSAHEVVGLITAGYDRIMLDIEGPPAMRKHLMIYMPAESAETIFRWGLVEHDPRTDEGRAELAAFIASDVRGAFMTASPNGAVPFIRGHDPTSLQESRQVVLGNQLAWFCDYYRPRDEHGHLETPTEQALLIKYVVQKSVPTIEKKLRELDWSSARRLPELDLRAIDIDREVLARRIARAPSWRNLVDATRPVDTESPQELGFREAVDWLLGFQEVELDARVYPFVLAEAERSEALVRYDPERDQRRIVSSPIFVKYAATPALRPEFGSFFAGLENEEDSVDVEILEDRNGRPGRQRVTAAQVVRREGQDRLLLRTNRGEPPIPASGWLRPAGDRGSQLSLDRQRSARNDLYRAKHLQGHLRTPRTIRTFEWRWRDAGRELKGSGGEVVREMLVCEPFAAVQGPPGTGKTRVAATAIGAYLERFPAARILVSAQSNFALDNLAIRVLKQIGEMDDDGRLVRHEDADNRLRPVALRITGRGADSQARVDPAVQKWQRLEGAVRLAAQVRARVERRLAATHDPLPPLLGEVLDRWSRMLGGKQESVVPELADRLHRGANLVFATCAASTPELLFPASEAMFDWVIVEEAAKAWPTELAIPLLRGRRWTLIGDHFQLPAHRRDDLKRFLDACAADPSPRMAQITPDRVAEYMRVFDLFGGLFAGQPDPRKPLRRMSVQFRMREPIGDLVSRVFYPELPERRLDDGLPVGGLDTHIEEDPALRIPLVYLNRPRDLNAQSLVWLDTAGITSCHDEPHWSNPGEAAVVQRLLEDLDPFPRPNRDGYGPSPLAVLTPYREQLSLLQRNGSVRPYLSTIHAFQGREADIVIVSLVRDTPRGGTAGPRAVSAGLGHLAQRQLVNVLFSRARRLLVIVGRFEHFASITGPKGVWTDVCRAVELNGVTVKALQLYGDLPGLAAPAELGEDEWAVRS